MQGGVGEFVDLRLPVRNDLATIRMRQSSKKPGHAWIWSDGSVTGIVIDRSGGRWPGCFRFTRNRRNLPTVELIGSARLRSATHSLWPGRRIRSQPVAFP
jgi:hypothetical protein